MPSPISKSPSILILSASVGAGHMRAAEAVELALKQLAPTAHIHNADVVTLSNAVFKRLYATAYLDLVNKAPALAGIFYDLTDKAADTKSRRHKLKLLVERANLRGLSKLLESRDAEGGWDIVINTHFLPAELLARLRRKRKTKLQHVTVVTDFDAHGFWANEPTDHYFAATEEAAISLGRWGVERKDITITGIPIHPVFAAPKSRAESIAKQKLSDDRPNVLLLAGGFGVGPIELLFESILKMEKPIHLVAVCGKNEALKKKLEALGGTALQSRASSSVAHARLERAVPPKHKATVLGFTKEIDELMAAADLVVSKPGGLTTSECLARGVPMAIVNPIPGQESRNSDYLLENAAAIKINSAAVAPHKIETLLTDKDRLTRLRANAARLGHPRAAFEIAEAVLGRIGR